MPPDLTPPERHWRATRRLTASLLAAWFLLTVGCAFFGSELAGLRIFGWPAPFYLAAQGSVLGFVAIVGFYAWRMDRIDARYAAEEQP
jgi:putative solute:sodium symporter small subunit